MKKILICAGIAATLAIGGGIAVAQEMKSGPDANRDGAVNRAELDQALETRFARLDANRDGRITQDERSQMRAGRMERRFERLDTDKNGSISRTEFDTAMEQRMARRGAGGPGGGRGDRGGKGAMVDADNDGAISKQEFTSRALERFEANDVNKDGQVTREERRVDREERRRR